MPDCPSCGRHLAHAHRAGFQKFVYSDVFRCGRCGYRLSVQHAFLRVSVTFVFSRHTHCVRCGTPEVRRSVKRDRVDSVSNHPLSRILQLTGAPVNRCLRCRLQYYDWRRPLGAADVPGSADAEPLQMSR